MSAALTVAAPAFATAIYSNVVTPTWSFTGIQETSSAPIPHPEPLFGQPVAAGDQLAFFPPNFLAQAAGAAGYDSAGSQLQLTITPNSPSSVISGLTITEFGDATLLGFPGTAATGTFASMSGFLTVTQTTAGPITPVVIPWTGTFTPGSTLTLPGDFGTKLWSGTVSINVGSVVPNATKAVLSYDDDLFAFSELGTSAKIQKKVVSGPAVLVTVVPEPGTVALLALGLGGLGLGGRRH